MILKLSVFINYVIPRKFRIKIQAFRRLGITRFNISKPNTYNEKINYRKLHYKNYPLISECANKLLVRDYVSKYIGESYLPKLYAIYKVMKYDDIKELPDKFVLKNSSFSGMGSVLIVNDKNLVHRHSIDMLNKNQRMKYGQISGEKWYDHTDKFIIAEELLFDYVTEIPVEFKVYCFNYQEKFDAIIRVIKDRGVNKSNSFYDLEWNLLEIGYNNNKSHEVMSKPNIYDELIRISKILSSNFDHVRVDFMLCNNQLYVGELTFADTSGFIEFDDIKWDILLGEKWKL